MTLIEYIKSVGDSTAADFFGVEERTVASWRRGERCPRTDTAKKIVKSLNGLLSLDDCYT